MGQHVWVGLVGEDIVIEHAGGTVATYSRCVSRFGVTDVSTLGGSATRLHEGGAKVRPFGTGERDPVRSAEGPCGSAPRSRAENTTEG
jgi:hypothetical protein